MMSNSLTDVLKEISSLPPLTEEDLTRSDRGTTLELKQIEISDKQHKRTMKDKRHERVAVVTLFIVSFGGALYLADKGVEKYTTAAFSIAATFAGYFLSKQS